MRITLLSVAGRLPAWVDSGYETYAGRLRGRVQLQLLNVRPGSGAGRPAPQRCAEQAARLRKALPRGAHVVALDETGECWNSRQLAAQLADWEARHAEVALLVGGADGLDAALRAEAAQCWSLSPLTLPHALVRVLVAEQLYRAWSLLQGHPYHRD